MTNKYVTLMETSADECESWYYFLKYNGNEEVIDKLKTDLDMIDESIVSDEINIFDIDIENTVSEQTAKEMTYLELNCITYHRKFDGKMKEINFQFKDTDKDNHMLYKVFDILGNGNIQEFIEDEDIPVEHMLSDSDNESYSSEESLDRSQLPDCLKDLKLK